MYKIKKIDPSDTFFNKQIISKILLYFFCKKNEMNLCQKANFLN